MMHENVECPHPLDRVVYYQLNVSRDSRITAADLTGGINPYVWRIEYCGKCLKILRTLGEVPAEELARFK